ncbi:MAG: TonB-dependent receptor [Muribaculaceae bacterium]|nr:TonB-dependent receptor [Muribaculaceae bacterium]
MKRIVTYLCVWLYCLAIYGKEENDSLAIMLEEINVTAIKQANYLRQEPEAVSVLTSAEIDELAIVSLRGVSDVVPNFFMPDYGSRITSTIYVRGIGSRIDQPSVGLNVDNVPFLNKDAYDFDIADIAYVEMFRGPQSTLYGRNTMAGLINITTLSPFRYQGWRIFGEIGNGARIKASLGWYHKFNDLTALSISGDYSHLGGFFTNEYNGKKIDKENSFGLRTKFQWRPSNRLRIQNTLSANLLRQGGYPYEYAGTGKIEYNDTCFYRRFTLSEGLTVNWRNEDIEISSLTSLQHIDDNMTLDQDFLPESYFNLTQKKKETDFTEEIVVKGNSSSGIYHWLSGVFGFFKHLDMDAPVTFKDVGIRELIESHRNDANPTYPIKWDTRSFVLNSKFKIPTWGIAAYHESEVRTGNWNFIAALRVDYEKATLKYHSFCNTGYEVFHLTPEGSEPYRHIPIDIDDYGDVSHDYLMILPKLSAVYLLSEDLGNIYAKISRGYKAGGFNTNMFSDVLQQRLMGIMGIGAQYNPEDIVSYKPEKSWNYEIGSHLSFKKIGLTMDMAAFYIDCRDQQLTIFPDGTTTGRMMANAGKTRSFGFEISGNLVAWENIEFNMSYGYTNAKFKEFFNGINNYAGKRLPYVPSNTFFVQGLYSLNLSSNRKSLLLFDINFRGTGSIYWSEENDIRQKFYGLLGASVSWMNKNLEIKIWGKNLSDTNYKTFYFKSMGNEFLQRGRGLEAGVTVRYNIGKL